MAGVMITRILCPFNNGNDNENENDNDNDNGNYSGNYSGSDNGNYSGKGNDNEDSLPFSRNIEEHRSIPHAQFAIFQMKEIKFGNARREEVVSHKEVRV